MANLNAKPSLLGSWTNSTAVVSFYSQIPLGGSKLNGIVLGGWSYSGWSNTTLQTVNIGVLEQGPDGLLRLNTAKYIADPTTNGEGSVITTDLNGDGVTDIFLAAHNESPLVPTASTVYLSQPDGSFKKVTLPDSIEAHSAILGYFNGVPTITTAGYGPTDPYYQFNKATQSVDVKYWGGTNKNSGSLNGSSSVVGDFLGDGKSELVIGDFKTGPGYPFDPNAAKKLVVYSLNGGALASSPSFTAPLYFDQAQYANKGLTSEWPGLSHNYRTWTDDFNHDGKLDILLGVGIWSSKYGWQKDKLQMFQNQGALSFTDVTDRLGQAYDENTSFVDYSMQILDIDKSGISSYLMAGDPSASGAKQSNYLMLNDGTGKLYAALHNEFQTWSITIGGAGKFIAYQLSNGAINYVAQTQGYLYNLPLQYVVANDFTQNITVADRNNSKLMRTWAGSDTFTDTNANSAPAHIDGGLGLDTSNYNKPSSNYQVKRSADGSVSVVGNGLSDTLVNVERLQFTDKTVALDINGTAGQAYRIYQAAFNRTPDNGGLKYWIGIMDSGAPLTSVSGGFIASAEFQKLYGTNPTNELFVTKLYDNVLHRTPDTGGYNYWVGLLNSGGIDKINTLVNFSESNENQTGIIGVIQNGISLLN